MMRNMMLTGLMAVGLLVNPVVGQKCADIAGGNGKVDIEDLLALLGAYGGTNAKVNLVGSTKIDIEDLLALLGQYGKSCKSSPSPPPGGGGIKGMYIDVYPYKAGLRLSALENPSSNYDWAGMVPLVEHVERATDLWYSNDRDFNKEIPGFKRNDKYMVRFRGYFIAPTAGTYQFKTRSDDGSQLFIKNKLVVNNDGDHGPRDRTGSVKLTKGWNKICITFYENGGGAMLQVSVKPPGSKAKFIKVTKNMLTPLYRPGMRFEAYDYKGGVIADWDQNIHSNVWTPNKQKAKVAHWNLNKAIWYSNDNDFVKEIPKFSKKDKYVMRWRGQFWAKPIAKSGNGDGFYYFRTRSDDGSRLWINHEMVVNNDGNHGPRTRTGKIFLKKNTWHDINIVFYENGGGAMLQVSYKPDDGLGPNKGKYLKLTTANLRNKPDIKFSCPDCGMYVDVYDYKAGQTLSMFENPSTNNRWSDMLPIKSHPQSNSAMWYNNDREFNMDIPGFNRNDKYMMRFRGYFVAANKGKHVFMTCSDDGSQLFIANKRVVNNDGDHGRRCRSGSATLKKGWNKLVVTFYENGGGANLQVSVRLPGGKLFLPITRKMTRTYYRSGMRFDAYKYTGGRIADWDVQIHGDNWYPDGKKAITKHWNHQKAVWYSNDNEFIKEIPKFNLKDKYILRFRGQFWAARQGTYQFRTRSDDGSRLWINHEMVVNNDGNHGPRTRTGNIFLRKGTWNDINIVFYENGGGAVLQVSVNPPGRNAWMRLDNTMTRAFPDERMECRSCGMYVDVYKWNGKSLKASGTPYGAGKWDNQDPIVSHIEHNSALWYNNDRDFNKEIPGFKKNDRYAIRFRGYFNALKAGTHRFRTCSDDGSMLYVRETNNKEKLVVNNDGNHGRRCREGTAKMKKGWNRFTVTFYENGGGANLQVSVKQPTANYWMVVTRQMTRLYFSNGMRFDAWDYKGGSLKDMAENLHYDWWKPYAKAKPLVTHWSLQKWNAPKSVWYSNDKEFIRLIPKFKKNDKYIMRFRGMFKVDKNGRYGFRTRSDDGSRLYIDNNLIVENDGNHGPRTRTGYVTLKKGWTPITVMFYENGGGAMLQVSVNPPGRNAWMRLDERMTRAMPVLAYECNDCGLNVEVYKWNGKSLAKSGDPGKDTWDGQKPIVAHLAHGSQMKYTSDRDFNMEIPGFKKNDRYSIRFRGYFVATKKGTHRFQTCSDDGSMLYLTEANKKVKLVVNNDGNHGRRCKAGSANLKKGWNKLVVTFYENGGGANLQVDVVRPGSKVWTTLSRSMLKPIYRQGMRFDAWHYKSGVIADWKEPNTWTTIHDNWWVPNKQKKIVSHWGLQNDMWYNNDNDFVKLIAKFSKKDKYVMRWRGQFNAKKQGRYYFQTRSDDGSMLYIDHKLVVDNDGNHGPRTRTGSTVLTPGWHAINVVFYENGGGAMLQVGFRTPGATGYEKLNNVDVRAKPLEQGCNDCGLYVEVYKWNGKSLAKSGDPGKDTWDGQKPIVAHLEHQSALWYNNDRDFNTEIPGFKKNDRYSIRFRGYYVAAKKGAHKFQTCSDDGSMLYLTEANKKVKLVVNNDGNHGRRCRSGSANLKKGWNKLVVTFYENGGGANLQVTVMPPGSKAWTPLTSSMLKPIYRQGMRFEAFKYTGGVLMNWQNAIHADWWKPNNQKPFLRHWGIQKDIWFNNDNDFKKEIPKFKLNDKYVMRWRGQFEVAKKGRYYFRTCSDDGSLLYINRQLIVNNDGNHGTRCREGYTDLPVGWAPINVVFYENGGGARLQVSVKMGGGAYERLSEEMVRAKPEAEPCANCGLYVDVYKWNGQSLKATGDGYLEDWGGQVPVVSHIEHSGAIWYNNDREFNTEIPGFKKNDRYSIRFRGFFVAPKAGTYKFQTCSDDGSMLYIREGNTQKDNKLIVNNDGNHGRRCKQGTSKLKKGWNRLTITFYENGGGANLQASVMPPGAKAWDPLTADQLRPIYDRGLRFDAFKYTGGSLKDMAKDVHRDNWRPKGQKSFLRHWSLKKTMWFNNDNDFKKTIPKFKLNDKYIMRWRGQFEVVKAGRYYFRTESDDGSRVYLNEKLVVENDGNHGPRARSGSIVLKKGWAPITIVFYENGGGARLRVWVRMLGAQYVPMTMDMSRAKPDVKQCKNCGLWVESYNWNGKSLAKSGNPNNAIWGGQTPRSGHSQHLADVWYNNDREFNEAIPGFKRNNRYSLRFRGYFVVPKAGTYGFQTCSDDGSMLYIKGKLVVNNDGNHGRRCKSANAKVTKGWNKIVITFYENGGGANLQVSTKAPGKGWVRLSKEVTRPIYGMGAHLQVFHYTGGTIGSWGSSIHADNWRPAQDRVAQAKAAKPIVTHATFNKDMWYSNDNDFKKEIPKFNKNDKYVLRFRGSFYAKDAGRYTFRTRSDDGSKLWVNRKQVVNNDGNHGPRTRAGSITLKKESWNSFMVVFYENGGGAMLQVDVRLPGAVGYERITSNMLRNNKCNTPKCRIAAYGRP